MIVTPPTSITVTGHERQVGSRDTVETMEYRTLGRSGCLVSTYALGTMTFGAESDEPTCHEMLDVFIEAGGTLVDTADVYTNGRSEQIIGSWLADRPADITDRLVLASKARFPMGTDGNDAGLSRRHLRRALEASLRRLDVDHLDLYQVHGWDPLTPLEESVAFLDEAVQAGTISYWGLSNYTGWQVVAAVDTARSAGLASPVTMQPQYNLLAREVEWEIVPACEHLGIGLLPWSPLGGGWLTGKYRADQRPEGATRLGENPTRGVEAYATRAAREQTWSVLDTLERVAALRDVSVAQVALAWVHDRSAVSSVILGARTVTQLRDNLDAAGLHLTSQETLRLDEASEPACDDYPYGRIGREMRSRASS